MWDEIWYNTGMKTNLLTKEQLHKLDQNALIEMILQQQSMLEEASEKIDILLEQVNLAAARTYGRSSEKGILENQICLFNEVEAEFTADFEEPKLENITYTRKKRSGKREEDLKGLPTRIEEHVISEEVLKEHFPGGYVRMEDEIYRKLEHKPAVFEVVEHHIAVYRGKDGSFLRAEHPVELLDKSVATPSLCAGLMNAKYVNAAPLYRIEKELERNGITLSRQVMSGWMIKLAERYLSLVYDRLKAEILSRKIIHADETPVKVSKDGRGAGSKSYMWVYRSNVNEEHPAIVYDYRKSRATEQLKDFLGDFDGYIISDGYAAYHQVAKEFPEKIKVCGCWAHARRKFAEIIKTASGGDKKKPKYTLAVYAVEQIGEIYHLDSILKEKKAEERQRERQLSIAPRVEALFAWAKEHYPEVPQGSNIGKALNYLINQEPYLKSFLENPEIPLDNNAAERAIRPFCVGKKNWQMIDTVHGAHSSAMIYSLAETAKANNLKPYEYFKLLLEELPKHMEDTNMEFLDSLLPWSETLPEKCRNPKA